MNRTRLVIGLLFVFLLAAGASVAYRVYVTRQETQQALLKRQAAWENLVRTLEEEIARFPGDVAVVMEDLKRGWQFAHQPTQPFPAASLVKVPMMVVVFQAAADGTVNLTEPIRLRAADQVSGSGVLKDSRPGSVSTVAQLIELMIARSDNTATNLLINRFGFDFFHRGFEQAGLHQTRLVRKMIDFTRRDQGIENYTTAEDIAAILRRLYGHELVDHRTSERCLDFLKRQTLNDRIPAKLPPGTVVAHKTGLERHLCHDAGIVFTDQGDCLIVVLTRSRASSQTAKTFIATLAFHAHQYMVAVVQSR